MLDDVEKALFEGGESGEEEDDGNHDSEVELPDDNADDGAEGAEAAAEVDQGRRKMCMCACLRTYPSIHRLSVYLSIYLYKFYTRLSICVYIVFMFLFITTLK